MCQCPQSGLRNWCCTGLQCGLVRTRTILNEYANRNFGLFSAVPMHSEVGNQAPCWKILPWLSWLTPSPVPRLCSAETSMDQFCVQQIPKQLRPTQSMELKPRRARHYHIFNESSFFFTHFPMNRTFITTLKCETMFERERGIAISRTLRLRSQLEAGCAAMDVDASSGLDFP